MWNVQTRTEARVDLSNPRHLERVRGAHITRGQRIRLKPRWLGVGGVAVVWLYGCVSSPETTTSVGLQILGARDIPAADNVTLAIFDQAAVKCKGAVLSGPAPTSADSIVGKFTLGSAGCPAGKKWCLTGEVKRDDERVLTWYIEGTQGGSTMFTGCTERAVDQNPLQLDIRVQPYVPGAKCGDSSVIPPETCDPGGPGDEACDASACRTNEVVLSNGLKSNAFFRGLPGRKKDLRVGWLGDGKFFGMWSDASTGSLGGDASPEMTVRRLTTDLISETAPIVLKAEVRLPTSDGGATTSGNKRRSGANGSAAFTSLKDGSMFVAFVDRGLSPVRVHFSLQRSSLGLANSDDTEVSTVPGAQDTPAVSAATSGDVLVVYTANGGVRSVLRKADGTLLGEQKVSSGTADITPRVAFTGTDWVVVWSDGDDIKLKRVGTDGLPKGAEVVVNAAKKLGKQDQPDVAALDNGEFLVVWRDGAGDVGADIRGQRFDKLGAPVGTLVNTTMNDVVKAGDQATPAVAGGKTAKGRRFYLVVWQTTNQIGGRYINGDADGYLVNSVNGATTEFAVGLGDRPRVSPAVSVHSSGTCAVGFVDESAGDQAADNDRVRVRRLPPPYVP